ncbi:FadR/GntR family transcriptional regulator [Peribacillus kribbensis]|uniref:FadR/GntR family transcriptional regulator n=1 Tax=Peribacillus kribbensis TaxID=356658 RepID=UPI000426B905|nr:FadR/GntR family transcriptional regulator [Peribacillus kribbensis]
MEYKKIKPKKIYEQVAEAIHDMIRSGNLKPGEKLDSVEQLASHFQVGRSAIREALTSLKAMGLIEIRQGEGTYIKQFETDHIAYPVSAAILMNKEDIAHLLEVRKILEVGTAYSAAQKRSDSNLLDMEHALKEMKQSSGNEKLSEQADVKFHLAIAEGSKNPLLSSLMNHVSGMMAETIKETRDLWLFSKQATADRLYEEHAAIYNAIKEQNPEKARSIMHQHIENVENVLHKNIFQS